MLLDSYIPLVGNSQPYLLAFSGIFVTIQNGQNQLNMAILEVL